jgi:hypothetical protein
MSASLPQREDCPAGATLAAKPSLPSSLVLAVLLVAGLMLWLIFNVARDAASHRIFPPTLLHLSWHSYLILGIWRRWTLAWRVGYVLSAICGVVGIACSALFVVLGLHLSWRGLASLDNNLMWLSLEALLGSVPMCLLYYLLRRPASIAYFQSGERGHH